MKKIVCAAFCALLIFTFSFGLFAADFPLLTDEAGLLSVDEYSSLENELSEVSEKLGWDIIVITLNGLGGKTPEKYADDFMDENGFRNSDTFDAALLLVSMEDRDVHVATSGECINALDEDYVSNVVITYLGEGDYYGAFERFIDECENPTYPDDYDDEEPVKKDFNAGSSGIISAIVGVITSFVSTGKMKSKLKSVGKKQTAAGYVRKESFSLVDERDTFLYSSVSRTAISRDDNRSGGGNTHVSSGGHTYGGSSGKF